MTEVASIEDIGARLQRDPQEFRAELTAWLPTAPPDEVAMTRNQLVDVAGYLKRYSATSQIEALRAARLAEWEMARRWPVNADTSNRTDDRPQLAASNSGADRVAWQAIYAVGRCDREWLLNDAREPHELTQAAVRKRAAGRPPVVAEPRPPAVERFGTVLADPPWDYPPTSKDKRLRGYTDQHYTPLTTDDLCALPVADLATDEAVLLLWTTFPFVADALRVVEAWGFDYVTGLAWVKANPKTSAVAYGVGYWFRGAVELCLVGKRKKSYRSQYVGLVHPGLNHSRKPESIHQVAEATYPGPRLELFAREKRDGWTTLGLECPGDGEDVRESIPRLVKEVNP